MPDFDLFVIGGGSGGVACARRAASHGAKVGLAEHSKVGGTCVIRGCVPKKLMHYGAHFQEWFKAAHCYGWEIGEPKLAFERLCEVRNQEIARLNGIYLQMLERAGVRLFPAHARLLERRDGEAFVVRVGEEEVTAARVLVAVGARPSLPELPGIELAWTSDEVLENVYPLPERLAVVGAGYIGLELASILNALGSRTTLVLRGEMPLRGFEHDLRQHLTVEVEGHGVALWNETRVERIDAGGGRAAAGHQPRPARGGRGDLRHRPLAGAADGGARAGAARRGAAGQRHGRGRCRLPEQQSRHLRGRRLQRSCRDGAGGRAVRPDAGRDRRGPGGGRAAVQRQPDARSTTSPSRPRCSPCPRRPRSACRRRRRGRPGTRSPSTGPASGRCSTR